MESNLEPNCLNAHHTVLQHFETNINTLCVAFTIMHMEMQNDKLLEFKQHGEGNEASDKSNVVLL